MTKQELLAGLSAKPFVSVLMTTDDLNTVEANGAKRYRINFFEVVGNAARAGAADFYVINEGQDSEKAYWFEKEPAQS